MDVYRYLASSASRLGAWLGALGHRDAEDAAQGNDGRWMRPSPGIAYLLLVVIVAVIGALVYVGVKRAITQSAYDELEANARIQASRIEDWLDEPRRDVSVSINTPLFVAEFQAWKKGGMQNDVHRQRMLDHLATIARNGRYQAIALRTADDGRALLSVGEHPGPAHRWSAAALVGAEANKWGVNDEGLISTDAPDEDIQFHFPFSLEGAAPLGIISIEANPNELLPHTNPQPEPVPSAETLLMRRDGDQLVSLSALHHLPASGLHERSAGVSSRLLTTQVSAGSMGALQGIDHRGVATLAYATAIAGTAWVLITKIDTAVVYASLHATALLTASVMALLLLLLGGWMVAHRRSSAARSGERQERAMLVKRIDFLVKHANDGILLTDVNGRIVEVNERLLNTYGFSRDDIIHTDAANLYAPYRRAAVQHGRKVLLTKGEMFFESEHLRKDGRLLPVEISVRKIEIEGQPYFKAIIRDISERKRMERALRESEERFRQAFEHAPIGMALVGLDGGFLMANPAFSYSTGYSDRELTAMSLHDITCVEDIEGATDWLAAIVESEGEYHAAEKRVIHKDGRLMHFMVSQTLVRGGNGKPMYVITQTQNITEQKRAAARITKLAQVRTAISITNQAIIRGQSLDELYQAVCHACVEHGGFSLAWIGLADTKRQQIVPIEIAGTAGEYLRNIAIDIDPEAPEGKGPTAIAYRDHRVCFSNDLTADPAVSPWHEHALTHGLRASIALPLLRGGIPYGTLSVYGSERNFFDGESVEVLLEMADNISFAIDQFDLAQERKESEERLRKSEAMFRSLVDNLPQKIFVKDVNSVYMSCNAHYANELGMNKEQIIGKSDFDLHPAEHAENYRDEDRRVIESDMVQEFENGYVRDGEEFWMHTIKAPFKDDFGETVGVLGVFWDITAAKRAETALTRYASEVEDLYQNAPCGYHSIDSDGKFLRINNTELGWLGYTREELIGRKALPELLTEESLATFKDAFVRLKATGEVHEVEVDMVRKDGTVFAVAANATAVYDAAGNYVASRTTVFDITERRRLEEEQAVQADRFENLSRRLVAVQESERRHLARELHDRANPNLAAIKLMLGTLAKSIPAPVLATVESTVDDVRGLLDDTTAGIREICADLRPTLLDYAGLVATLEGYAQIFMKRTGVIVNVKTPPEELKLDTDVESMLFRITQEALTNCAKHACAKTVDIELSQNGPRVSLSIRDDGFGFETDNLGQEGVMPGMGLITMRERAEFAGATFHLSSHPLKGTEIKVELDESDVARPWQHKLGSKTDRRASPRHSPQH